MLPMGRGLRPDRDMVPWFPVAGLVIGMAWAGLDAAVGLVLDGWLRSWIAVLLLAGLTGGLHLDGLADTADGLLSHRGRERALEIMRDSRIGTWGVLALVAILGIKAGALGELEGGWSRAACLVFVPAYARAAVLAVMAWLPYVRGAEGMASGLSDFSRFRSLALFGVVVLLSLVSGPGWNMIWSCLVATLGLGFWFSRILGGVTGDTLGTVIEVGEAAMLLTLASAWA